MPINSQEPWSLAIGSCTVLKSETLGCFYGDTTLPRLSLYCYCHCYYYCLLLLLLHSVATRSLSTSFFLTLEHWFVPNISSIFLYFSRANLKQMYLSKAGAFQQCNVFVKNGTGGERKKLLLKYTYIMSLLIVR